MYYKGELYQQAIGEIRATLADSPDRLDLQALLADIYLKINQRVEAADAALAVMHRLPNCLITIRVMIQVLSSTEREMEQKTYRQRLAQLDPYSVFAAVDASSSDAVSEHAIKFEKLDWKPDTSLTGEAGQPAWAASLGVDLGDLSPAKEDSLPEWLSGVSTEPGASKEAEAIQSSAFTFDEAEPSPADEASLMPGSSEEEIPDWLRQAGWGPSTGEGEMAESQQAEAGPAERESIEASQPGSLPQAETGVTLDQTDDQLAGGDMPDWLKAMAPAPSAEEQTSEETENEAEAEEDVTPWLEKLIPSGSQVAGPPLAAAAGAAVLADWLQGNKPPTEEVAPAQPEPAAELPDWLTGVAGPAVATEASEDAGAAPAGPEAELTDWSMAISAETASETPDILSEKVPPPAEPTPAPDLSAELPDWLLPDEPIPGEELSAESTWEESGASIEAEPAEAEPAGELPDWLLAVQAVSEVESETPEAGAVPAEVEPAPIEAESGLPDWLLEAEPVEAEATPAGMEPAGFEPAPTEVESSLPDWLLEAEPLEAEAASAGIEPGELEQAPIEDFAAELPDWLQGVTLPEEEAAPVETVPAAVEPAPSEAEAGLPVWLLGAKLLEEDAVSAETEPAPFEPLPAEAETGLPDWLLGMNPPEEEAVLAETEPASFEPTPTEAEAELSDWLQSVTLPEEEAVPAETAPVSFEPPPAEADAGLPDWLQGVTLPEEEAVPAETGPASFEPPPAEAEAGLPDRLLGVNPPEEEGVPFETESASFELSPSETEAGLPDWLQGVTLPEVEAISSEIEPPQEEPTSAEPANELPDWLLEAASLDEKLSPVASKEEAGADFELPAWLFKAEEPAAGIPEQEGQAQPPEAELFPAEDRQVDTGPAETSPAEPGPAETSRDLPFGELPDWLSEAETIEETLPAAAEPAAETPAWLFEAEEPAPVQELEPEPAAEEQTYTPETAEPVDTGLLGWLKEFAPAGTEPTPLEAEPVSDSLDWLFEPQEPDLQAAGLPDWLQELTPAAQGDASLEAAPADEIPAWLFETEGAPPFPTDPSTLSVSESQLGDTQPLRVKPAPLPEAVEQPEATPPETLELDDAFAWLMGLTAAAEVAKLKAQEEPAPEMAAVQAEALSMEAPPETELPSEPLQEQLPIVELPLEPSAPEPEEQFEPAEEQQTPQAAAPEPEAHFAPVEELLTAEPPLELPVERLAEQPPVEPAISEPSIAGADLDADNAFAWLESLAVKQGASEALILKPEERLEDMPDWVRQDALAAEQAAPQELPAEPEAPIAGVEEPLPEAGLEFELPVSEPAEPEAPAPEAVPETVIDQDLAFAWLESLAVKQGANEALILKPEERQETMPDWVRQDALAAQQAGPQELPVIPEAPQNEDEEILPVAELETEPLIDEPPFTWEELQEPIAPPSEEAPVWPGTLPSEPEPAAGEEPVAPLEPAPAPGLRGTGGLPDLPDWLTDSVISPREELEWTPPPVPHRRYDLNQASLSELERLPGIGFIAAQQITAYRDAHGPFRKVDDLSNVPGIGSAMIRGINDYLFVVEPEEPIRRRLKWSSSWAVLRIARWRPS